MGQAYTERFSEVHELDAAYLAPALRTTGQYWTGPLDMANRSRAVFLVFIGVVGGADWVQPIIYMSRNGTLAAGDIMVLPYTIDTVNAPGGEARIIEVKGEDIRQPTDSVTHNDYRYLHGYLGIGSAGGIQTCMIPLALGVNPPVPNNWDDVTIA